LSPGRYFGRQYIGGLTRQCYERDSEHPGISKDPRIQSFSGEKQILQSAQLGNGFGQPSETLTVPADPDLTPTVPLISKDHTGTVNEYRISREQRRS
jgi:hypothetical protein